MALHARRDGPDPAALRVRLKELQDECDLRFFQLLKAAEQRTRERYL